MRSANDALEKCTSIDQVVARINGEAILPETPDELACIYVYQAVEEAQDGFSTENIAFHIDVLSDAGAEFNHQCVLKTVLGLGCAGG